jgi:hypothetical protein
MNDGTEPIVPAASEEVQVETPVTEPDTVEAKADTPDFNRLVEDLEKNWDKVPPELRARLDKNFQPAFNRKLNLLQNAADTAIRSSGIQIPEGKTALDLLTENEGKDFGTYMKSVLAEEIAPIKEKIGQAEQQQTLQASIQRAVRTNPEIQPYVEKAIAVIDSDADLTKMAMLGNGNGLFYVLQAVAGFEAKDQKIRELTGLLEKNKIAYKTAGGTTRAGAQAPKAQPTKAPKTLREAARQAMEMIKADQEAGA